MKLFARLITVLSITALMATSYAGAAEKIEELNKQISKNKIASRSVKNFVLKKLLLVSTNPTLVKEVNVQNSKNISLAKIKSIDNEWKAAEDELPIQSELLSNAAARELKSLVTRHPAIIEVFVMDNQGANVGQNQLTGDYWQGDEYKWKRAYNKGEGGFHVGNIEYDKSANAQLQQVSLPIIDQNGKVIGAITYGLNLSKIINF